MEYERDFRKQIWSLRNQGKPLPNSAEAKIEASRERIDGMEETSAHGEEKSCQSGEERGR